MIKHLQNNRRSEEEYLGSETFHYFWSGSKYTQVEENIQGEFCNVIKVKNDVEGGIGITLLNSLCDISGSHSTSILKTISSRNSNSDLNNKVYQQVNQLKEAAGLCIKQKQVFSDSRTSRTVEHSSTALSALSEDGFGLPSNEDELIYTCQCKNNYGYENCTEVKEDPINGINAGNSYCQSDVLEISLEQSGIDDSMYIIFIDHAVFGKPLSTAENPLNLVNKIVKVPP